jgi:chemotaxis response regulator CheB
VKIAVIGADPAADRTLRRVIAQRPRHQLIWVANAGGAVARCARQPPDLTLIVLPVQTAPAELAGRIVAASGCAILIVTDSIDRDAAAVFQAAGGVATDTIDIAECDVTDLASCAAPLLAKLDTMARLLSKRPRDRRTRPGPTSDTLLIAIGASSGGPAAVAAVLKQLPQHCPAAIVIVQHVDQRFVPTMTEWLQAQSGHRVAVARHGERLRAGRVVMAGSGEHLVLMRGGCLGYTAEPRDHAYCPSVDIFFESVSQVWTGSAVGVLLTGMGSDGALGLKALRDRGQFTIAQDEATSVVYGMPKAAAALNAALAILPLDRIGPRLASMLPSPAVDVSILGG